MSEEKRIEIVEMRVGDIKFDFGNPRKVKKKKKDELERSLEDFGDFGLFLIDENNNAIGGSQRAMILASKDPDQKVLCKRLIGYSEADLRVINIKDNTHAGEWDLDMLADWTADLHVDLGLDLNNDTAQERKIDEMELIHYEKYDYVMIVCRDELSYNSLVRALGIEDKKVLVGPKKRPIKGRAIWFDEMKVDFVPRLNRDSENNSSDDAGDLGESEEPGEEQTGGGSSNDV